MATPNPKNGKLAHVAAPNQNPRKDPAMKAPTTNHGRRTEQPAASTTRTPPPPVQEERDCYPWTRIRDIESELKYGDLMIEAAEKANRRRPALLEELWYIRREMEDEQKKSTKHGI